MQPVRLRATCSQRQTIVTPIRLLERGDGSYSRSGSKTSAKSTLANVPDLRRFVQAVLAYRARSRSSITGTRAGRTLNRGSETHGSTRVLVIRNADTSFVYFSR